MIHKSASLFSLLIQRSAHWKKGLDYRRIGASLFWISYSPASHVLGLKIRRLSDKPPPDHGSLRVVTFLMCRGQWWQYNYTSSATEQASGWRILDQIFTLISQVEHQDLPEARYRSNNVLIQDNWVALRTYEYHMIYKGRAWGKQGKRGGERKGHLGASPPFLRRAIALAKSLLTRII